MPQPTFFDMIYSLPIWLVEAIALTLAVSVGVGFHLAVQRHFPYSKLLKHNDVAGFLIAVVAVVYGVVLGFVVIIVWGKYDDATRIAQREQSSTADIYRLAWGLPANLQNQLRSDLREYARIIIEEEWPAMEANTNSHNCYLQSEKIGREIVEFSPNTARESNTQAALLAKLTDFLDARRERLRANRGVVQPILWWTLFLGMFSTVGFAYFFGTENRRIQLGMTAIICAVVMSMIVLIAEYDTPFSGKLCVPSDNWSAFLITLERTPEMPSPLTTPKPTRSTIPKK